MTNQEKHALIAEELLEWHGSTGAWELFDFDPSIDLNACARAERAIAERGLGEDYAIALDNVLQRRLSNWADMFHFITASAQDRVDAMLMLISDVTAKRNAQPVGTHADA